MITEKETKKLSKFLSFVLRHKPETIGIELDANGWTDVDKLISSCQRAGIAITKDMLQHIVSVNSKKRFSFDESFEKIRASQGHSVEVDLAYTPKQPPAILYHGTGEKFVASILKSGLTKKDRHHVHLSKDIETALNVGRRHGKPVVFEVFTADMFQNRFKFFLSDNGVWLTDNVPVQYLRELGKDD